MFESSMKGQSEQRESSGQSGKNRDGKANGWMGAQGSASSISVNGKVDDHWIA